jgi:acyl carrier protein
MRVVDEVRSRVALSGASQVGTGVGVFGTLRVTNGGELIIEDSVSLVSTPAEIELWVAPGARLILSRGVLVESGAVLRAHGEIMLGVRARVGRGCILDDEGPNGGGITVGNGAWVEDGTVLLGGTRVSDDAVWGPRAAPPGEDSAFRTSEAAFDGSTLDVEHRVRAVVSRLVAAADDMAPTANLADAKGWDSLTALRALVALEREFSIVLPHQLFSLHPSVRSVTPVILAGLAARGTRPLDPR